MYDVLGPESPHERGICRRALVPPWHDNDLTDEGPNERPAVALLAANFEHRGCETLLGDRLGRLLDRHAFGHLLVRHAPNDAEAVRSSLEEARTGCRLVCEGNLPRSFS